MNITTNQKMYEPKNFDYLFGLKKLSDDTLKTHFSLYQGYVSNVNKIIETLKKMSEEEKFGSPEWNELKRRFGWEFNGMRLHEYYFESMSKTPRYLPENSHLAQKIKENFGSYQNWEKDFKETARARGIGWVIFYYDKEAQKLFNVWIDEHDKGHPTSAELLLPIDIFEHAYFLDYGSDKKAYIEAFLEIVDWEKINERFEKISRF